MTAFADLIDPEARARLDALAADPPECQTTPVDEKPDTGEGHSMTDSAPSRGTIPHPDEADSILAFLGRHGITMHAVPVGAEIDAEQAAIREGTVVPISSGHHADKSVRDPNGRKPSER